jgi:hypothetical protein
LTDRAIVFRLCGKDPGQLTYIVFSALLERADKIRRLESGQPLTEAERLAQMANTL